MNKFSISGKQFPIPPPPVFDSEFDININKSIQKLWCKDEEIKHKMVDKFSIMSINIRSLPKNFWQLEISVDKLLINGQNDKNPKSLHPIVASICKVMAVKKPCVIS